MRANPIYPGWQEITKSSKLGLFDPQASWDDSTNKLVIVVGDEFEERVEDTAFDEMSDCVIATMEFDEKISFDMERI